MLKKIFFTKYSDPTKIKDYLSCGLPIIATNTFHNAVELKKLFNPLKKENSVHLSKIIINTLKIEENNQMRKLFHVHFNII